TARERHGHPALVQARSFVAPGRFPLRMDAQVIGVVFFAHVGPGLEQRLTRASLQLGAEPADAAILNEERQPRTRPRFARPMVAEDQRDLSAEPGGLPGPAKDTPRRRRPITA